MRILENEAMMDEQEVIAYDGLVRKYLDVLHAGFVESIINMSPVRGKFLDVGTGTGWIAIGVAKHTDNVDVTGIDLSATMLKVARKNSIEQGVDHKVTFIHGNATEIPFAENTFDAVFCHNMMHHLPEPSKMLSEINRVVKKDGAFLIRDLVRHSRLIAWLHVTIFGFTYNKIMKKEYMDSILASLSIKEWKQLFLELKVPEAKIANQFITHMTIYKEAINKRKEKVIIPVTASKQLLKKMYTIVDMI